MATKKTETTKAKPAPAAKKPAAKKPAAKKADKSKAAPVKAGPRHPRAKLLAGHGSKESLAKTLADVLATGDEDATALAARLKKASNRQLLRLASVTETVKKKWGSRDKLIAAITAKSKSGKDQDYVAKLGTFSLPRLVDLASRG